MNRLHIVGRKNHGKTTLMTDLIAALTRRGYCVGSIKHTHHRHEIDTPGKDSWRHRQAGAAVSAIISQELSGVFLAKNDRLLETDHEVRYKKMAACFSECQLVLVEGNLQTTAPCIEVWRQNLGTEPLCSSHFQIKAMVTDAHLPSIPIGRQFTRQDLLPLLNWICVEFLANALPNNHDTVTTSSRD